MDTKNNNSNFNTKLNRLEEIYNNIKTMEINDLEQLIELYQEGIQLSQTLNKELNAFEQKIIEIKENKISTDNPVEREDNASRMKDAVDFSDIDENVDHIDAHTLEDKQNNASSETHKTISKKKASPKKTPKENEISPKHIIDLFSEE